uniref:Serine/threonine-protein phosphatase 2A regulatory subunit B'' subunit beta n=1 Tax=Lygus hesperus TaxID=30085 RepID=A0A146L5T8_LYGHE
MKEKLRFIEEQDVLKPSAERGRGKQEDLSRGRCGGETSSERCWCPSALSGKIGSTREGVGSRPGSEDGVDLVLTGEGDLGHRNNRVTMAATVNSRKFPSEPEEDIAAIAKQISDHAEAIYQNWKSRGLAPTEILSCNNVMPEKFTASLTSPKKSVDILGATPNNLEQLVNNFVVEDKARIAREKNSPIKNVSSIQYAKQKFENKDKGRSVGEDVLRVYPKSPSFPNTKNETFSQFIMDTIETTLPVDHVPTQATSTPTSSGLQTWPLKNRPEVTPKPRLKPKNEFIDEVAKEEERLINALKTGTTVAEESPTSKPTILQKKVGLGSQRTPGAGPALEPKPMGIVKKVVKSYQEQMKDTVDYTQSGKKIVRTSRRYNEGAVPHPEHKQGNSSRSVPGNPVRPFLTRGSVAERVLIFEKCPAELGLDKRKSGNPPNYSRESLSSSLRSTPPPHHSTLQRHTKANKSHLLPRFYFPHGKSSNQAERHVVQEAIRAVFQNLPNQQATIEKFGLVTKACGCPLYWKAPLFIACGGEKLGYVELNMVLDFWRDLTSSYHDNNSKFLKILTHGQSRSYLLPEDFMSMVQDVVDTHPGLTFLKEAVEFHSRYVHTVISRIYYNVNSSWTGRISLQELRRSNLLQVIALLEKEEDINQITQYFSYEHFYVIYCKFWELDRDHDLFIDKHDLARHSDHALSTRLIDRIFSGAVTRGKPKDLQGQSNQLKMSYTEFVWFLLAEEDKSHPRAIEYWFRCMDLDGDGYLSMYELEYFYDEQLQRMEAIGIECLPFEDCLCQMLDMIRPEIPGKVSLGDLKKCKMTPIFFDTFFNLEKYLDHEQRDPFASQRDHDNEMSDWDRYAAEEYELLVAEEGGNDGQEHLDGEDDI